MNSIGRRVHRNEEGVVAVEFAVILVALCLLLFGIIEFGITYGHYQVLVGAAREGARQAAVRQDNATVLAAVDYAAGDYPLSETPAILLDGGGAGDPACDGTQDTIGHHVSVGWNQTFTISIPFMPQLTPTVAIRGVFRCE